MVTCSSSPQEFHDLALTRMVPRVCKVVGFHWTALQVGCANLRPCAERLLAR